VRIAVLVLFLAAGGVIYYLFVQNLMFQSTHERTFLAHLHQVSLQNRQMVALYEHSLSPRNFDRFVQQKRALDEELRALGDRIKQLKDSDLLSSYEMLMTRYNQKQAVLERLKAIGAVYNNSYRYLSELYEQLITALDDHGQAAAIRRQLSRFLVEASLGTLSQMERDQFEQALVERMQERPISTGASEVLALFMLHATQLLEASHDRQALRQQREAIGFQKQIEDLYTQAQQLFARRHHTWMVMGHVAFGVGFLFFVAFVVAFIQEERLKKRLIRLNADLSGRVEAAVEKQRRQEQILTQQSRLAAMGEMIGAIAHQWRQPLNALSITIQDLEDAWAYGEVDEPYIKRLVSRSVEQIRHMSQTINDFRNFFKESKEETTFELAAAILETTALIEDQFKSHNIALSLTGVKGSKSPPAPVCVRGYLNEFKQAVLNILSNAKDAIESRRAKEAARWPGEVMIAIEFSQSEAILRITDNGGGIESEPIDRVFEPYFSTKEQGQGSGIGLYMAKMIIETNMHGQLSVTNEAGGARFEVRLKRSEDDTTL
jgi:signal transduction histidine kinase